MIIRGARTSLLVSLCLWQLQSGWAAEPTGEVSQIDDKLNAAEAEGAPERTPPPWNEADLGLITARFGSGFLYDTAAYDQNGASAQQLGLSPTGMVRDFRF